MAFCLDALLPPDVRVHSKYLMFSVFIVCHDSSIYCLPECKTCKYRKCELSLAQHQINRLSSPLCGWPRGIIIEQY